MIYLSYADAERIAHSVVGPDVVIRDPGLLDSALARPAAVVFGRIAFPDVALQAAALLESIVANHALVDGNKRLGLACVIVFLGMNGLRLTLTQEEAFDLVTAVASSELRGVEPIGDRIAQRLVTR